MGLVAYLAIAMAAVRSNNDYWALAVMALNVSGLCTATVMAMYRRGAWAGFTIFGWAWLLICQPWHINPPVGIVFYVHIHNMVPRLAETLTPFDLSAVLTLSSVVAGLPGALVGWLIARGSDTNRRDEPRTEKSVSGEAERRFAVPRRPVCSDRLRGVRHVDGVEWTSVMTSGKARGRGIHGDR
jgi:hypothetical protein